jgi:hypothetical protein
MTRAALPRMPDDKKEVDVAALAAKLSDDLLADSRLALAAGMYELAYHALAGALHGAEAASDDQRLRAIQAEAASQQSAVDERSPRHRLSRLAGKERGHKGWFDALAIQANAVMSRQHAGAMLDRSTSQRLQERTRVANEESSTKG